MTATCVRIATTVASLLVLVVAGMGCSASTDKAGGKKQSHARVLRVLNTHGPEEVQPFADKVSQLSNGTLRLEQDSKWERGSTSSEVDAIHALQAGRADLALVAARAWHSVGVTSFDALIAPLEVDSMTLQQKVLASEIPTDMLDGVKHVGLEGIGVLLGPMRKPAGITRALVAPADYAGARIGFSPSAVADRSLRALGAIPVESGFEGASISTDDGIEQQVASVAGNQYDQVVRTITANVNLWPRPLVIVASAKAFGSLTEAQRSSLRSSAHDSIDAISNVQMNMDAEGFAAMCRRGTKAELITATTAQLAQLRSAFAPVYAWLRQDAATARYLDRIAALRAGGVTPYPQETLSCAGAKAANGSSNAVTPIDGVYEETHTARELLAAGSVDALPENYGTTRWVLDRGRWEQTQQSDRAATWTHGHYTIKGEFLTLYVDEAGGIAPSDANGKPGDSATLRWSLYQGKLRLRPENDSLKPDEYPLGATIKQWQRLGDAGSSAASSATAPTIFDGTYRMVTTHGEALKSDPNVPPENWGTWIFVFGRGGFAITQENQAACTWGYGTFVVTNDRIEWTFTDGGGIAPTQATNKPGEDFLFGWSRYRDTVKLAAVAGAVSPDNFLREPWHRLSNSPAVSSLSTRCPPPAKALSGL